MSQSKMPKKSFPILNHANCQSTSVMLYASLFLSLALALPLTAKAQIKFNVPINETSAFQQGMEKRGEINAAKRAQALEQLTILGDQAASQGVSYAFEEWEQLANELAGGGFLSVVRLSTSTLEMTLRVQNSKAEAVRSKVESAADRSSTDRDSKVNAPSSWRQIFSGPGIKQARMNLYVDPSTRQRTGSTATIWSVDDYPATQENRGKTFKSVVRYTESDCSGRRIRVMEFAVYTGQRGTGQVVHTGDKADPWSTAVADGSPNAALFDAACGSQ